MVTKQEFSFPSADRTHRAHAVRWLPEQEPRAVVQIVHGISEHIERYDDFAQFLAGQRIAVVGHDHLGHGRTATTTQEYGHLGRKNGWRHLVGDVHTLRLKMGDQYPGLPYILLGHSMGSFVTRTYLIDWPSDVDGAILSGTGQAPAPTVFFGKSLARLMCLLGRGDRESKLITRLSLGAYNEQFSPARTKSDWISRDNAVVDAYLADPLCQFNPSAAMFRDMMGGLQYIATQGNLRRMDPATPVYFFAGDADPVGSSGKAVKKVARWFQEAGVHDVTVKLYPDGRHEMLHELNRQEVYQDVLGWLNTHI